MSRPRARPVFEAVKIITQWPESARCLLDPAVQASGRRFARHFDVERPRVYRHPVFRISMASSPLRAIFTGSAGGDQNFLLELQHSFLMINQQNRPRDCARLDAALAHWPAAWSTARSGSTTVNVAPRGGELRT